MAFNPTQNNKNTVTIEITVFSLGTPGEIRTPDLLVRSQALYPAELRAHNT